VRPWLAAVPLLAIAAAATGALAQTVPDAFSATAWVSGGATATAPVAVSVTRYGSAAERDALLHALRAGGTPAARALLATMHDAGSIQVGGRTTAIKFAAHRPLESGELITLLTAEPIAFVGGGRPDARPRAGYDVAVAFLTMQNGRGMGELVPAAKIEVDASGALRTEDYGSTVVWLNAVTRIR
jgi:hypothetical protein